MQLDLHLKVQLHLNTMSAAFLVCFGSGCASLMHPSHSKTLHFVIYLAVSEAAHMALAGDRLLCRRACRLKDWLHVKTHGRKVVPASISSKCMARSRRSLSSVVITANHSTSGGERTSGQVVLALHVREVRRQVPQQLVLRLLLAHHGRHQLAQVAHDQDVDLGRAHALHKLVDLRTLFMKC